MPATVPPGGLVTFNFNVTAPAPGAYNFYGMMLQEGVEWFDQATYTPVTVGAPTGSGTAGEMVTYIHTDGLGSPVARSDSAGNVISRTSYEPYGRTAGGVDPTIGFTGHVNDADTGLVYMQQRYYDPVAGRFLSIDPVVTDANTGASFNRYTYANNNPYRYIDPDGRMSEQTCRDMVGNCTNVGGGGCSGSSGVSTSAKVGAVVGGAAAGLAAAGCDIYSLGGCAVANPAMVAGGIAGGAALGAVTGQQLDVTWTQFSRLLEKAANNTTGPTEIQYALVATVAGPYPDVRGGVTTLNVGDVWKYGTAVDPNGRYPLSSLKGLNLKMIEQTTGTRYQVLVREKIMLIQHAIQNGELPPGNRIFK
jgi:RHS repeat-associated protein